MKLLQLSYLRQHNYLMQKLEHFLRNRHRYEWLFILGFFFINSNILATSIVMENLRHDGVLSIEPWKPFVSEYSSAIATLSLLPGIFWLLEKHPIGWTQIKQNFAIYLLASVIYSLVHVGLMVSIRHLVYWTQSMHYDFGDLSFELFYEYRKDLLSFIQIIVIIKSYLFIVSRLKGEASPISDGEDPDPVKPQQCERLLVKKLGKEFIIKIEDVEWLESSGNYVNLHIKGRIYPTRATLNKFIEQIAEKGFCRIHRSHAVNLNVIDSITPLSSGDSEIKLVDGTVLNLSRRYKDNLKAQLH